MNRTDVLNDIIKKKGYNSYLEIGLDDPRSNFMKIACEHKESCDPYVGSDNIKDPKNNEDIKKFLTYYMTSNEMFSRIPDYKKWDIVFIDGLHMKEQVLNDVLNSMKHLNPNGTIVLHDCYPHREECQIVPRMCSEWNGDVWKTIAYLSYNGVKLNVLNVDYGIGIIPYQKIELIHDTVYMDFLKWDDFVEHKNEMLHVIEEDNINEFILEKL
jgi:hypothetical protein